MAYVYVPPATTQNAQRLANDLSKVIEEHKRAHPGLSKADIHQALSLAGQSAGADRRKAFVLYAVIGMLVALGLLVFWQFRGN